MSYFLLSFWYIIKARHMAFTTADNFALFLPFLLWLGQPPSTLFSPHLSPSWLSPTYHLSDLPSLKASALLPQSNSGVHQARLLSFRPSHLCSVLSLFRLNLSDSSFALFYSWCLYFFLSFYASIFFCHVFFYIFLLYYNFNSQRRSLPRTEQNMWSVHSYIPSVHPQ